MNDNDAMVATVFICACILAFSIDSCPKIEMQNMQLKIEHLNKEISDEQNN